MGHHASMQSILIGIKDSFTNNILLLLLVMPFNTVFYLKKYQYFLTRNYCSCMHGLVTTCPIHISRHQPNGPLEARVYMLKAAKTLV